MTDTNKGTVAMWVALLRADYAAKGAAVDAHMLLALVNDRDRLAGELAEARKWAKDAIFFDSEYVKAVGQRADEIAAENAAARKTIDGMLSEMDNFQVWFVETIDEWKGLYPPNSIGAFQFFAGALADKITKIRAALAQANKTDDV